MNTALKILIADDHSVVRQGISLILHNVLRNLEICHAADFPELMELLKRERFDMLILDIYIPQGKGTQMVAEAKSVQPGLKILIFSALDEKLYAMRYLKKGAQGYLNKNSSEQEISEAFLCMIEKGSYASQAVRELMTEDATGKLSRNPLDALSGRELEIARLLIKGEGNLEIANKLELQNSTVSTYKNRIFEKLAVTNTVALASLFSAFDEFST